MLAVYIPFFFLNFFCLFFIFSSVTQENESDSRELVPQNCIFAILILIKCHYVKEFYDMYIVHILHTFVCQ